MKEQLLASVSEWIVPLFFTALAGLGAWMAAALRGKWKNEAAVALIERVERIAGHVVKELDQQLVTALKQASEDGRLTPEEITMVSTQALQRLTQLVGEHGQKELMGAVTDVERWLRTLLESKVSEVRLAQKRRGTS